jgi:catechol 2,3-dioxygenase-like lactoylglutathione lyase family enzyme
MPIRFVHTNLIARDWRALSAFYQQVFGCKPAPPERDLRGDWLDALTGIPNTHITGEHLVLPGYDCDHPTLEIFSYDEKIERGLPPLNGAGLGHLAFEVDDVAAVLQRIITSGGGQVGEVVETDYPNQMHACFVYARDPEGNIIELQSWRKKS